MPYKNSWQNAVTFEMSNAQENYNRVVYSNLDLVSDLGGLYGAISPIFVGFVAIINYYSSY